VIGIVLTILRAFLGYAAKRDDNATVQALEAIKGQVEVNREKSAIIRAQLGHPIAWVPRFCAEFAAVMYFTAIVIDSIWDLPGVVLALPTSEAAILATIFGGMFLRDVLRK
jgi:hypothetical protein